MSTPQFYRDPQIPYVEAREIKGGRACYDKHSHATFSLGTILGGQANCWTARGNQAILRGSVVRFNPHEVHACNPQEVSTWAYRMMFIDAEWLHDLQRENGGDASSLSLFEHSVSQDVAGFHELNRLFDIVLAKTERLHKESALVSYFSKSEFALKAADCRPNNPRLQRAAEFIAAHCTEEIDLAQIGQAAHLSRSYLIRAFKAAFNMTPHAFLLNQRIHQAQKLLKRGDAIVQVAQDTGFADQAHFQRVFKRLVAATPLQYAQAQ